MKPSSAKNKGRRLCQEIRQRLLAFFGELQEDDVIVRSSGANGEDLILSPKARSRFPFSIEAKCQENISIWKSFDQANANAGSHTPLLVFRRNRSETLACLTLHDLIRLMNPDPVKKELQTETVDGFMDGI